MAYSELTRSEPPLLDPFRDPERFEGVLTRRVIAFMIDVVILFVPVAVATIAVFLLGIVTLGLGWALFWLAGPATVIWALLYYGTTLGGPETATWGMRMVDLQMRQGDGAPSTFLLGAVHAVVFWVSISVLSPLVLLVCFFNHRRRLLHDILLGTVVINNGPRAARLRAAGLGY
ncbi:RDD family protein [Rhodoplanes azumiensis]|uniref:RDD family protein n=1 Tax=Rhodoplanes azumiensis TaxID=1897628 RepID=A0ABW5AFV6_9BRAD